MNMGSHDERDGRDVKADKPMFLQALVLLLVLMQGATVGVLTWAMIHRATINFPIVEKK